MLKVGFTGTRHGMTARQRKALMFWIDQYHATEFHHGDCIGADAEAHDLFAGAGVELFIHPPVKNGHRAFKKGAHYLKAKTHFARNRDIVDQADVVLAFPFEKENPGRGGTWYTIEYAKKKGKPLWIFFPNGEEWSKGI